MPSNRDPPPAKHPVLQAGGAHVETPYEKKIRQCPKTFFALVCCGPKNPVRVST